MFLNSGIYIFAFLPIVITIYFLFLHKNLSFVAKIWLLGMSFFFYGWYNIKYLPILLFSILLNYLFSRVLNKCKIKAGKILLFCGITINLVILAYFKYMNFFIENVNELFNKDYTLLNLVLPLGISFFTFQQISYLCDSYRKQTSKYSFLNYALFVSFFPQLASGPIVYHNELIPQFDDKDKKSLNYSNLVLGIFLFSIGLFKKVFLADTLGNYADNCFDSGISLSIIEAWIASLSYTLQLYFDFSAYIDMALGSAKMLNIELPINFNSPYKAVSIQDFWHRWNITLSRFLKDYVYIPLGGNKKGSLFINIMITFLLCGLWHGANWMFILWGFLHGISVYFCRILQKLSFSIPKVFSIFVTFITVNIFWIIFRSENIQQALNILKTMFNFNYVQKPVINGISLCFQNNFFENILIILPLALLIVFIFPNSNKIISKIKIDNKFFAIIITIIFAALFSFAFVKGESSIYKEFIYYRF